MKLMHSVLTRLTIKKIIRELPVLGFFVFVGILCALPNNRDYTMPDHLMLFDHWWNFHERLRVGVFAQWNPFWGLGRIAVQWNHIPISIFTPFLLFSEFTFEKLYVLHVIGTFLTILSIYLTGRILKYGRLLSLLPVGLLVLGKLRYHNHPIIFSTFLFFYPIAIAMFVSAFSHKKRYFAGKWFAFLLLLTLSLTGYRLESSTHALVFLAIVIITFAVIKMDSLRECLVVSLFGLSSVAVVVTANLWHLSLVLEAMNESGRTGTIINIQGIFQFTSLMWIAHCFISRPSLILILLNASIYLLLKFRVFSGEKKVTRRTVILAIGLQVFLLRFFPTTFLIDQHLIFSVSGIISIVLSTSYFFFMREPLLRRDLFVFLTVLFTGFYTAEYINSSDLFMPLAAASFIACGVVRLWLKGRSWIAVSLALFHLFGEVGAYFLLETFDIPWVLTRAAIIEVPFRIILILEAVLLFLDLTEHLISPFFPAPAQVNLQSNMRKALGILALMAAIVMTVIGFPPRQLPEGMFRTWDEQIKEARERSIKIRMMGANEQKSLSRVPISGRHTFLPSYSQRLNTAEIYASEIPLMLKEMFLPASGEEYGKKNYFTGHPEMNPVLSKFLTENLGRRPRSYLEEVLLDLNDSGDPLNLELSASQGSQTPRIFLTRKIVKLPNSSLERRFLKNILDKGDRLTDQITTSDNRFPLRPSRTEKNQDFRYTLSIQQDEPEQILLKVTSEEDGFLALMDTWSRGWRAFVDGRETPTYRGYIGARFIEVERGEHIIEFRYRVPGLLMYSFLSIAAWIVLIFLPATYLIRPFGVKEI